MSISAFKNNVINFFTRQTFLRLYERIRYKNMSRRQRITFIVLMTVIPSLAILIGILTSCIYGVDYQTVAISLNRSTQRFFGGQYHNNVYFMTLATGLKKFPNGYFQISFSDKQINGATNYPSISVRTSQGTPLKINLFVKAKIQTNDFTSFYLKYGDDWMFYLRQKIPNTIIRSISNLGFYDLTNVAIIQQCKTQLSSFDEFSVNIINLQIELPSQFLSNVNGTIGWNVFQKQAELLMLKQSSDQMNIYLNNQNKNKIEKQFQSYGTLQAQKDQIILNKFMSTEIQSNWRLGMQQLKLIVSNVNYTKSILWYYYQSYYNSSFNPSNHQLQFN